MYKDKTEYRNTKRDANAGVSCRTDAPATEATRTASFITHAMRVGPEHPHTWESAAAGRAALPIGGLQASGHPGAA
jgi:hypothetical protein